MFDDTNLTFYLCLLLLPFLFAASSQSHKASSHAVRFRVCQLINKLLGSMAENAQIDDDLFDRIHQAMLVRVNDKFPNVRIQAALAMTRLQQPQEPDCPTISGLLYSFKGSKYMLSHITEIYSFFTC